jgi:hypothetical protein
MHPTARQEFNRSFSEENYKHFVEDIEQCFPDQLDFRVAETPAFIPLDLKNKLKEACSEIIESLLSPDFIARTNRAVPASQDVPNENAHSSFLAIDFAICRDESGALTPQLIELQGFPSLFSYQAFLSEKIRDHFSIENQFDYLPVGQGYAVYARKLRELIVAGHNPEQVILLDIFPEKQKTRIDFAVTEQMLGVKPVCYTKLIREGRKLFYYDNGKKIQVRRIYNRLIFDDLLNYSNLETSYKLTDDVDVEWVGHPNWFFRISKYSIPFLKSKYVPETKFVSDYKGIFPDNLDHFVLKPLFSFAGSGVQLHVTDTLLNGIKDPENYILQKKVTYEPAVQAPDGLVKCEIRMMFGWADSASRPEWLIALSRLSRGEMIGVRFNQDFTWVGGSAAFFEEG